jgi:hypothetical protein
MKAFPTATRVDKESYDSGMNLRDYFAAKAMQAIISNSDQRSISVAEAELWIGKYAYTIADVMMKARND